MVARTAVAALLLSIVWISGWAPAGLAGEATFRCRGTLHFGDALARAATVFVDLSRGEVFTPDCRKYPHLDRYCGGALLDIADHSYQFGGALSRENTKFWADLYRPSRILPASTAGPATEAMRVLFLGRCEPVHTRRTTPLK